MARCSGNLRVAQVVDQRGEVAPTVHVLAAGHGAAIAPGQGRVARSCGNLQVDQVSDLRADQVGVHVPAAGLQPLLAPSRMR